MFVRKGEEPAAVWAADQAVEREGWHQVLQLHRPEPRLRSCFCMSILNLNERLKCSFTKPFLKHALIWNTNCVTVGVWHPSAVPQHRLLRPKAKQRVFTRLQIVFKFEIHWWIKIQRSIGRIEVAHEKMFSNVAGGIGPSPVISGTWSRSRDPSGRSTTSTPTR